MQGLCFYSGQQKNKSSFNVLSKARAKKGSVIFILSSSFMKRLNENTLFIFMNILKVEMSTANVYFPEFFFYMLRKSYFLGPFDLGDIYTFFKRIIRLSLIDSQELQEIQT